MSKRPKRGSKRTQTSSARAPKRARRRTTGKNKPAPGPRAKAATNKSAGPAKRTSRRPASGDTTIEISPIAVLGGMRGAMNARELFWNNVIRDILMSLSVMKVQHDEAMRMDRADHVGRDAQGGVADASAGSRTSTEPGVIARSMEAGRPTGEGTEEETGADEARADGEESISMVPGVPGARTSEEAVGDVELSGVPPFDGRMGVITREGVRIAIADVYPLFACSIEDSPLERALSEDVQCSVFQIRTPNGEVFTIPVHEIRTFHALSEELMGQIAAAASRQDEDGLRTSVPFGFGAFTSLARAAESKPAAGGGAE